jgi:hypothetical protein
MMIVGTGGGSIDHGECSVDTVYRNNRFTVQDRTPMKPAKKASAWQRICSLTVERWDRVHA